MTLNTYRLLPMGLAALIAGSQAQAAETPSLQQICRAGIAAVIAQDAKAVKVTSVADGVVTTEYTQPINNKVWTQRCRLIGNRVVWAQGEGRWRDGENDGVKVTYTVDGNDIAIRQVSRDGSFNTRKFGLAAL